MRGIANSGSHMFDLITYLFGKIFSADSYLKIKDFGDDPTISSILELHNGLICNIVGLNGHQFRIFDIDIIGTKGRLIVNSSKQVTQYISGPSQRSSEFNELQPEAVQRTIIAPPCTGAAGAGAA